MHSPTVHNSFPILQLVVSLRRSLLLALVAVGTVMVAVLCAPAESRGDFVMPSWRGAADATWYQWANPPGFSSPVVVPDSNPEAYSYAPSDSLVPALAPAGTATMVTRTLPIGSGNLYSFAADPFTFTIPSFLTAGTPGTVVLQARATIGDQGALLTTPQLAVGGSTVGANLLQQVTVGTASGDGNTTTVEQLLYSWDNVSTDGGPLTITFDKGAHVSVWAVSVDTTATVAPVPEPGTTAAAAAAAAMAAAGYGRRRLLRRGRQQATTASVSAAEQSVERSPSSSSSSSSPSSQSSSASCSQLFNRPAKVPAVRSA
jgi:hypothetical protein